MLVCGVVAVVLVVAAVGVDGAVDLKNLDAIIDGSLLFSPDFPKKLKIIKEKLSFDPKINLNLD